MKTKKQYAAPRIERHEKLAEVTAQVAPPVSGPRVDV